MRESREIYRLIVVVIVVVSQNFNIGLAIQNPQSKIQNRHSGTVTMRASIPSHT